MYGPDIIPLQENLLMRMNWNEGAIEQSLQMLSFVPTDFILRSHYTGKPSVLQPNDADPNSVIAMAALAEAMRDHIWRDPETQSTHRGVGMLVRVQKAKGDPYLGVLLGRTGAYAAAAVDDEFNADLLSTFVLHRLPFADDVRDYAFPLLPEVNESTTPEQKEIVNSFIDSITVRNGIQAQGLRARDPTLEDYRRAVQEALLGEKMQMPGSKATACSVPKTLMTHKFNGLSRCDGADVVRKVETIFEAFGMEVNPRSRERAGKASRGGSAFSTRDIDLTMGKQVPEAVATDSGVKQDVDVARTGAATALRTPGGALLKLKLHSINPEGDLAEIERQYYHKEFQGSDFERQTAVMEAVDTALLIAQDRLASYHGTGVHKVGAAVLVMARSLCLKEGMCERFNTYMMENFNLQEPDNRAFFDAHVGVEGSKLMLISALEESASTVSPEACSDFSKHAYDDPVAVSQYTDADREAAAAHAEVMSFMHDEKRIGAVSEYMNEGGFDLFDGMD